MGENQLKRLSVFCSDLDTDQTTNGTFLNLFMRVFYLFRTKINQKQWECETSEICHVIEIETIVGSLKLEISYLSLFCWQKYVWSNAWRFKSSILILTLIGMRGDTFISLSFLDQILSAEFLSKISKLFWRWKLTSIGLIWHPAKLIESYKKCP